MCSNGGGAILESYNFSGKIDGLCKVGVGHRHEQPILIVFYFLSTFPSHFWICFGISLDVSGSPSFGRLWPHSQGIAKSHAVV
jgi:hypothetical protein